MTFLGKFAHIFRSPFFYYSSIPVPFDDWELWWFEHSVSYLQVACHQGVLKTFVPEYLLFSWPWIPPLARIQSQCLPLRGWCTLTMTFIGNFAHIYSSPLYLTTAQSECLMAIESYDGLNTLWHSYGFACQQRVLKFFYCPDYEQNNQKLHFDGKLITQDLKTLWTNI